MIKSKVIKLFIVGIVGVLISCNTTNNTKLEQTVNEMKDSQEVLLKKMNSLETAINNLALASKNRTADNKKQPPQADPNKVYNIPIGDSFVEGNKNAAVTIIEWSDFQ